MSCGDKQYRSLFWKGYEFFLSFLFGTLFSWSNSKYCSKIKCLLVGTRQAGILIDAYTTDIFWIRTGSWYKIRVRVTYRDKTHQTSDIKRALGHGHGAWGLGHGAREREMRGEAGTAPADKVKWRRQWKSSRRPSSLRTDYLHFTFRRAGVGGTMRMCEYSRAWVRLYIAKLIFALGFV